MPGYVINGKQLGIEKAPWAKRKCLYLLEGTTYYPLAYFNKPEYADKCMEMLDLLAHAPALGDWKSWLRTMTADSPVAPEKPVTEPPQG